MVLMQRDADGVTNYRVLEHTHSAVSVANDGSYWRKHYKPGRDDDGYFLPDEKMDCAIDKVANAHLISSAPELYYALQSIVDDLPSSRDWLDPVIERTAREALKKARGEA